jgi:hypothetical protein
VSTITTRGYIIKGDKPGSVQDCCDLTLRDDEIRRSVRQEKIGAEKKKLLPENIGIVVTDFLAANFADILNYGFTADVEESFELKARKNVPLMTCRHCIKRIAGLCAKNGYQADYSLKHHIKAAAQEPLYIHNDTGTRLRLEFDCKKCEMTIYKD